MTESTECGLESFVFRFLSKYIHTEIFSTFILPIFYMSVGCKTWSLTVQEVPRLRVFQNRVVRRIFWPMEVEVTNLSIKNIMRRFTICSPHQIELGRSKQGNEMHKFVARVGKGEVRIRF
jgi:hypothetical protein